MSDVENFHLARNDFDACTRNTFKNLLTDGEAFADVTLACGEEKQVKAHKVILSACSPFFRRVLLANPHQHPLVYLKGISAADLEAIVAFIYQGETSVSEEQLDSFLSAAQELEVEGLRPRAGERGSPGSRPPDRRPAGPASGTPGLAEPAEEVQQGPDGKFHCPKCDFTSTYRKSITRHLQSKNTHPEETLQPVAEAPEETSDDEQSEVNPNDKTIESEDNDYMETGNDEDFNPKRTSTVDLKLKINLKKEVQEREQCDQCDFSTTHKKNLRRHVQRLHTVGDQPSPAPVAKVAEVKKENHAEESSEEVAAEEPATVTYSCEKCDTTSRNKWDMSRHILRIHKEMKYLCDHCDFKSTQTHRLREHIVKKH